MTNEIASATIAAGWYPDPVSAAHLRWWNGVEWSDHTRPVFEAPTPAAPIYEAPTHPAPAEPAPNHPAPTFSQYTQPANPYSPANHYSPANPYATAANPYAPASTPSNGLATWSLLLGILSAAFTLIVVFTGGASIILSTSGVFAIINGIRALGLVSQGRATARIRPIFGIALGAVGTLIMVGSFLGLFAHPNATSSLPSPGQNSGLAPAKAPADAWPPSKIPDNALDSYKRQAVIQETAAASGCRTLVDNDPPRPDSSVQETPLRAEQQEISWRIQYVSNRLRGTKIGDVWPSLREDPDTRIVYTKQCDVIGTLPQDTQIQVALSPDGKQIAVAIFDPDTKVGSLYRSVDNTDYLL